MKLGSLSRSEICSALAGLSGSTARVAAQELADRLGVSVAAIYRITREVRAGGRKARSDRGAKKVAIEPHIEDFMLGLTHDADMSADHVIYVTAKHFGLPEDFLSISTYNAWLRRSRMSRPLLKKDLRPYRAFEAPRANHLHHYDTTVAEAFYINDDGSVGNEPGYQRYKNKPGNRRPRLILYSLIDDYSRVIYARFYVSENTLNLLDFCLNAWSQKEDKRFPMYGIPLHFYCDQGAPAKSRKFTNAAKKLDFHIVENTPSHATEYGSRKHGKVERTFGEGLLGEFMKITKIWRFASVDELNSCLMDWLVHLNNRQSAATQEGRFARWLRTVGTPRCAPNEELFKLLHYDRATPTVTKNLQFRLNGKVFQLPYKRPFINWVDCKIEAFWYPGSEETVTVVHDFYEEEITAQAAVIDVALDYKSVATTDRDERLAEIGGRSYKDVNFAEIYRDSKDVPYVPRKGEEFDEKRIAEKEREASDNSQPETRNAEQPRYSFAAERYFSFISAIVELRSSGFFSDRVSEGDRAWLRGVFAEREQVAETELKQAVDAARAAAEREVVEA